MGEQDDFTVSDSDLLLAFANIEIDSNSLHAILKQLSEKSNSKGVDEKSGHVILSFDRWLTAVLSHIRGRLMTGVLGTKYGLSAPSYLDNVDNHSSANSSPGRSVVYGVGAGMGIGMGGGLSVSVNEPFTTLLQRASHGVSDLQISVKSRQSSPTSFTGAYIGYDRERDREREPADFSRTFDSNAANDTNSFRDDSMDDIPMSRGEEHSDQINDVFEGKGQTEATGLESRESERSAYHLEGSAREDIGMGPRPNSFSLDIRRRTVSADFTSNLSEKSDWTRMVASRSVNNVNAAVNANAVGVVRVPTLSLPPVKAQELKSKAAKKRMLLSNGFNESFGRATPRCLKSDTLTATSANNNGKSSSAIGSTLGSFGGQNKDFDNYPVLTDTKTIMDTVEVLRKGKQKFSE